MIIGGVNAAGKAGGLRTGYCEMFLPCSCYVYGIGLLAKFTQKPKTTLNYQASVRIRNVADTAWINLGTATSYLVNLTSGALGTATVTLKQPEIWSPFYEGGLYPDVLRPSNRRCEIWCGIVSSVTYPVPVFTGHITATKENVTGAGGEITLELEDLRDIMQRKPAVQPQTDYYTKYRMYQYMVQQAIASGSYFGTGLFNSSDSELPEGFGNSYETIDDIVNALIAGEVSKTVNGAGTLELSQNDNATYSPDVVFEYDDAALIRVERSAGAQTYNTVNTYGLNQAGVGVIGLIQDAADVAKRGRIYYAAGYVGSPTVTIEEANTIAAQMIQNQLDGSTTLEVQYNPYLAVNMFIAIESSRVHITKVQGQITKLTHSYSASQARTTISDWRGVDYVEPEPPVVDPDPDQWTIMLMHCDGTNGTSNIVDETGKALTSNIASVTHLTTAPKFGTSSILFNGGYLSTPDHTDFNLDGSDFTIDFWIKPYTTANSQGILSKRYSGQTGWIYIYHDVGKFGIYAGTTGWNIIQEGNIGSVSFDVWQHIAVSRQGNTWYLFKNGNLNYSWTSANQIGTTSAELHIGDRVDSGVNFTGEIDEFRISKGIARWTASFVVPTAPYEG